VKVHKNRVLRRIFGPKRGEVMGGWRKMHNEVFNLCSSLNIRVIKSRRMKWTGHVARMRDIGLIGKLKGKNHSEDLVVDGTILRWILGKSFWRFWTGCIWLERGTCGSCSLKVMEFLD